MLGVSCHPAGGGSRIGCGPGNHGREHQSNLSDKFDPSRRGKKFPGAKKLIRSLQKTLLIFWRRGIFFAAAPRVQHTHGARGTLLRKKEKKKKIMSRPISGSILPR